MERSRGALKACGEGEGSLVGLAVIIPTIIFAFCMSIHWSVGLSFRFSPEPFL